MDQPQAVTAPTTMQARYLGRARDLYPLYLGTLLLTIITLGFYRFWARTRVRKHIWNRIVIDGDGLEYTGTGKELFIGFLKVALLLSPAFIAFGVLEQFAQADADLAIATGAVRILLYVALFYLFYVGYYAATRYRLSRTRWRSIRFHQAGSPWRYGGMALLGTALRAITLGFYTPFLDVSLVRYETQHRRFGTAAFGFEGAGRDLFRRFALCWILMPFTLGLSWFWYDAARLRYIVEHTQVEGLTFALSPDIDGWAMLAFKIGNFMIALLTLGLGYPIVVRRTMRFWCDNVAATGTIDFARVGQATALAGSGEGLAGYFNADAFGA